MPSAKPVDCEVNMIEQQRAVELIQKFVVSQEMPDDEISGLSIEEFSFVYFNTELAKKDERYKNIHFPIRQQILYWAAVEALKKAEALYVAFTPKPLYPFLDARRNVWIFTTLENAQKAMNKMDEEQQIKLTVQKVETRMIQPMLAQLYFWGIEDVILDNLSHPMMLKRSDILPQTTPGEQQNRQEIYNGKLQAAMIQQAQFLARHENFDVVRNDQEKMKIYTILSNNVFFEMADAKFLVPAMFEKDGQTFKPGQQVPQGARPMFAFMGKKDSEDKVMPIFTDFSEFIKSYNPQEMGAVVMTFEAAAKIAKSSSALILINRNGTGMTITPPLLEAIDRIRVQKAQKAAEAAGEEKAPEKAKAPEVKKEAPKPQAPQKQERPAAGVTYGDLIEEPSLLMAALKRTAKASKMVKRMWLAQRIEGDQYGYLMVVEGIGNSEDVIAQLKNTAKEYLDGKTLECRSADPTALSLVKDIKPFYKKGIFG